MKKEEEKSEIIPHPMTKFDVDEQADNNDSKDMD